MVFFANAFCEEDDLADAEADDSNVTLANEDDAHKVILSTRSFFFKYFW